MLSAVFALNGCCSSSLIRCSGSTVSSFTRAGSATLFSKLCAHNKPPLRCNFSSGVGLGGGAVLPRLCLAQIGRGVLARIKYGIRGGGSGGGVKTLPLTLRVVVGAGAVITAQWCQGGAVAWCRQSTRISHQDAELQGGDEGGKDVEGEEVAVTEPQFDWLYFWQLLRPQLKYFIGAVVSALVVALANVQIPLLLGEMVNVMAACAADPAQVSHDFWRLITEPATRLVKAYTVQAGFTFVYITFLTLMGEGLANTLRQDLFESLLKQDIAFYDQHRTGELVNRLTADVQDFKSSFKMCVSQGIRSITQIIGCSVSLYSIAPGLAACTAVMVPAIIGVGTALGSLLRALSRQAQHQVAVSTGVAEECLGNVRTVRSFASEEHELRIFAEEVEKSRAINEALGFGIGLFQAGSNLFLNGVVLGTLWVGGSQLASGALKPGDLMAFLTAAQTIQRSLGQLSVLFGYYVRGVSAASRVFEYVKLTPTIPLRGGAIIPYHTLCGNIEFNDVCFSYPSRPGQEVLHNFSLSLPAGKVVALVGESGSGKTTIAQLLERFYDVCSGSITVDGQDVRSLDPAWLRGKLIGFIDQEPVLFATSVLENIRYGKPDATDEEVVEAAVTANADGFIRRFADGYATVVGERGVAVSGGQKQRIAIARALLKNPRVLILDEATSALDAESERVVQEALEKCSAGRTVLVIAHRLSTVQNADVIAVVHRGRVAEIGTHASLKQLGGLYAKLIQQQQKK